MFRRILLPLTALCLVFAGIACGSSFRSVQERVMTEAELLKQEAAAKNLRCDDVTIANGYLADARATSNAERSANLADLAAAHYRIALARHSLAESVGALGDAAAALRFSEEQVEKYGQVLTQVDGGR